jgi:hypothetical protein
MVLAPLDGPNAWVAQHLAGGRERVFLRSGEEQAIEVREALQPYFLSNYPKMAVPATSLREASVIGSGDSG